MATYNFWIPSAFCHQIRSNDQDTLAASTGLRVMNAEGALHMDWPPQTFSLAEPCVAGQGFVMSLQYLNVDVPGPTPESADGGAIYWSFLLVNSGHPADPAVVSALATAADGVAGALLGSGSDVGIVVGSAILGVDLLARLLTTGCDGAVAAQTWAFTAAQLATMAEGKVWGASDNYPGGASNFVCGSPSNYDVNYTVSSLPPVRVPFLGGMSPDDARSACSAVGLTFTIDWDRPNARVEEPTVGWQSPWANLFVPPGSIVHTVVDVPHGIRP